MRAPSDDTVEKAVALSVLAIVWLAIAGLAVSSGVPVAVRLVFGAMLVPLSGVIYLWVRA